MIVNSRTEVVLSIGFLAALAIGFLLILQPPRWAAAKSEAAAVSGEFFQLPDVELIDQRGHSRPLNGLYGDRHLSVISFNYTTCQSICGVGNAIMQALDQELQRASDEPVRLMSITINPMEDTPAVMAKAAQKFAPSENWLWLTGAPGDIDAILDQAHVRSDDIQVHELVFLIGDVRTKRYFKLDAAAPDVPQIIAAVKALGGV